MEQLRSISLGILLLFLLRDCSLVESATFNFVNNCGGPVWPGILSSAGSPKLETTGFQLPPGGSRSIQAPTGWSGRFWGRTGCSFDSSGRGACSTGDCGSNQIECNGAGATPPATLVEFTLASGSSTLDFYDVSLVDGYNLPMLVQPSGSCMATGCTVDLNQKCPAELKVPNGDACKSACEAFNKPEYCCNGAFANPNTCKPTVYSQMFKSACPRSYSYAYDDQTSTFTCTGGANYVVTFCPGSTSPSSSQKSSRDSSSTSTPQFSTPQFSNPQFSGGISNSGTSNNYDDSNNNGVMLQNDAWLASLSAGHSAPTRRPKCLLLLAFSSLLIFLL